MKKLSELATAFQQTSQKELDSINESVKNATKQHENDLIEQLQHARSNISNAIQTIQQSLIDEQKKYAQNTLNSTKRAWKLPSLIIGSLLGVALIATVGLTWYSKTVYQDLINWQHAVEVAKETTGGIMLSTCKTDKGLKPCVAIDTDYKGTWGDNMKILKINKPKKKKG